MRIRLAIHNFYKNGQKNPQPVLKLLRDAVDADLCVYTDSDEAALISGGCEGVQNGADMDSTRWIECAPTASETLGCAVALKSLLQFVLRDHSISVTGVLFDPDFERIYLSPDIIREILPEAEDSLDDSASEVPLSAAEILQIVERADACSARAEDPANIDAEKSFALYMRAYNAAKTDKDLFIYPDICLRLAQLHPHKFKYEELLAMIDEAIAYFKIRINAMDPFAPDLLVLAQRTKEQAEQEEERRIFRARYLERFQ